MSYTDEYGTEFGYCNACGEDAPVDTECCEDGEVVEYDVPRGDRVNPLLPGDESDYCTVCGCRLRDNRLTELKPCPWGPHDDDRSAA